MRASATCAQRRSREEDERGVVAGKTLQRPRASDLRVSAQRSWSPSWQPVTTVSGGPFAGHSEDLVPYGRRTL